jgi:hypothetical protein
VRVVTEEEAEPMAGDLDKKYCTVETLRRVLQQGPAGALVSAQTLANTGNLAVLDPHTLDCVGPVDLFAETYEAL